MGNRPHVPSYQCQSDTLTGIEDWRAAFAVDLGKYFICSATATTTSNTTTTAAAPSQPLLPKELNQLIASYSLPCVHDVLSSGCGSDSGCWFIKSYIAAIPEMIHSPPNIDSGRRSSYTFRWDQRTRRVPDPKTGNYYRFDENRVGNNFECRLHEGVGIRFWWARNSCAMTRAAASLDGIEARKEVATRIVETVNAVLRNGTVVHADTYDERVAKDSEYVKEPEECRARERMERADPTAITVVTRRFFEGDTSNQLVIQFWVERIRQPKEFAKAPLLFLEFRDWAEHNNPHDSDQRHEYNSH